MQEFSRIWQFSSDLSLPFSLIDLSTRKTYTLLSNVVPIEEEGITNNNNTPRLFDLLYNRSPNSELLHSNLLLELIYFLI